MGYRAILLDVMGTLVYEPFFEEVPAALGMPLEEILAHKHPTAWVDFEKGRIDEATFLASFFADGRSYDHQALRQAMIEAYAWLDGAEELLADLCAAGHELHLLSNYPSWYRYIEEKLGLSRYAPWTFVSWHTGVRKPDPEAYLGAARALDASPGELLFVDDRLGNCDAARRVGLDAILFAGVASLRVELCQRGLIPSQRG